MEGGRKQPQMKQPLPQPTPPHSPHLPTWKWCMRQLPPSKPGHKGATPSTSYSGERATHTSTHVACTPPEQLIAPSHPGKTNNSHPTRPQGKGEGNENAPSHQPKKKAVKFSQQNDEKSAHQVWKRKEEGKNSATSEIRSPPQGNSSNEEKKQFTTAIRSPPHK